MRNGANGVASERVDDWKMVYLEVCSFHRDLLFVERTCKDKLSENKFKVIKTDDLEAWLQSVDVVTETCAARNPPLFEAMSQPLPGE